MIPSPHALLSSLLRSPLGMSNVERKTFPVRFTTRDEVIVSHRFILLLRGRLRYVANGRETWFEAGSQLWVPAWVRRQWRVVSRAGCELIWVEFVSEHFTDLPDHPVHRKNLNETVEVAAFERMRDLWPGVRLPLESTGLTRNLPDAPAPMLQLELEGELKACLARFFRHASPRRLSAATSASGPHPALQSALEWLGKHYADPAVLEKFRARATLSPNYFRRLFRAFMGCSVQDYLLRLRMRRARYLVHESALPLKMIAGEVGFRDPLFFSRQYRRFWHHPPKEDRFGDRPSSQA